MSNNSINLSQRKQRYTSIANARKEKLTGVGKSVTKKTPPYGAIVAVVLVVFVIGSFIWIANKNKSEDTQEETEEETQETTPSEEEKEEAEEIEEVDVSEKSGDSEAEDAPSESDFSTDSQSVGDEEVQDAVLGTMEQQGYEGFLRIIFNINSEGGIPYTTATLESGSNMIRLKFIGLLDDNSGVSVGSQAAVAGSVVSTILHNVTSEEHVSYYSIGIKEATPFYLHTLSDQVVLDIKEQAVENGEEVSGEFSKEAQTIEGDAQGNVIIMEGISHQDLSSEGVFRITYRIKSIGSGNIPHVEAELTDYEGGKAVKVVISNMSSDFAASGNYDESYNSVGGVIGMKGSFSANVSTYYIKLSISKNYKLYYTQAPAQILVDIKR
jgi:hypothetical protein